MAKHSPGRDDSRLSDTQESPSFTPQPAQADCDLVRKAWATVSDAHWAASLAQSSFSDLAALFQAIADASPEHTQAERLAKIGLYLAEDWATKHGDAVDVLEPHLDALRAAMGLPEVPRGEVQK